MAAQCPLCQTQIPDDFGLIECPNCSAQLLVHMDGRVEYSGAKDTVEDPTREQPASAAPEGVFEFGDAEMEVNISPSEAPAEVEGFEETVAAKHEFTSPDQQALDEPPPVGDPEPWSPDAPSAGEREPPPAPVNEATQAMPDPASPDLSDIARFGNGPATSARDGSLRYNLRITGIDTADVREAFREAITDRRMVWDIDEILRSIKNGEVQLKNISAPKAYLVVIRVRHLPVHIEWEQYALSQA